MQSAGNDIVALRGAGERTTNERFYRQVVSAAEQGLFGNCRLSAGSNKPLSFGQFVWLAWSVKEALFKFIKRSDPGFVFSPVKMEIKALFPPTVLDEEAPFEEINIQSPTLWAGTISSSGKTFFFKTKITQTFIASIVDDDNSFENMHWGVRETNLPDAGLSQAVRDFAGGKLTTLFPGKKITISEPNGGFPVISLDGEKEKQVAVSFSHHKGFLSYAINTAGAWVTKVKS